MKTTNYKYIGGRNRMPVYPFILSFLYHPNLTDAKYFSRGKIFNIILSIVLLFLLFLILRIYLDEMESRTFIFIAAFTVFIYRAGYFQCELLFYFLNFCTFLLFWSCLKKPSYWIGASSGVIAALSHLTKASILPAVFCFVFFYTLRHIIMPLFKKNISEIIPLQSSKPMTVIKHLSIIFVFLVAFLVILYPYISNSKNIFGSYFYNVNSTFYIWYDSWDEVKKGTRAHKDRVGWPQMAPDKIPSVSKYFHEHTSKEILKRIAKGLYKINKRAFYSYGYYKYFCIYLSLCLFIVIKHHRKLFGFIRKNSDCLILFYFVSYFIGYYLLYAFYTPIASGPRLSLALFMPAMFTMMYFLSKVKVELTSELRINGIFSIKTVHIIVNCLLVIEIIFDLPFKILRYSGN